MVAARIIRRIHREATDNPADEGLQRFLEQLLSYPGVPSRWRMLDLDGAPPAFLTTNYKWKNSTLRFFSARTTLGTALDVALQDLRIETFSLQMKRRGLSWIASQNKRAGIGTLHRYLGFSFFYMTSEVMDSDFTLPNTVAGGIGGRRIWPLKRQARFGR